MKNKILITGGLGYVGSRLACALAKQSFHIRIIDQNLNIKKSNIPQSIEVIIGDLRNKNLLRKALQNIDAVVHLAANIGSMSFMDTYPADILVDNTSIDNVLYPALIESGVKTILYSSSSMVYQHALTYPYKESDLSKTPPPTNIYGFSKLLGEYFCRSYQQQYGLNYVILRYHNIYGPGEITKQPQETMNGGQITKHSGFIHVLPALLEKVLQAQYPLELLGGANDTRPFTYIDDAIDATIRLVEEAMNVNKKVINQDFNIGPRQATKILDLAKLLWSLYGDNRPFAYMEKKITTTTAKKREMDPKKIQQVIGWEPKVSLKEGIRRTAEWMKKISDI